MKSWRVLLGLTITLVVVSACTSTAPPPTSTSSPTREWDLENVQVSGSTVTVSLYVFAGIDVWATLDGRRADDVHEGRTLGILEYVFLNVAPGQHTVEVQDVVGFSETAEVVVSTSTTTPTPTSIPTSEVPAWLSDLIRRQKSEPVANPPAFIAQYEYNGQTVYFLPQRCCDIFSDLYDADGNIIGHPDGGITGQGDGLVPDFFEVRRNETIIWRDQRAYAPDLVQVTAPIESVEVLIMESFPLQYSVIVVSGLPNACVSYGGYRLERDGNTIRVEMVNWKPSDLQIACAEIYRTVETMIPLGSEFESGKTYTVDVNGVAVSF